MTTGLCGAFGSIFGITAASGLGMHSRSDILAALCTHLAAFAAGGDTVRARTCDRVPRAPSRAGYSSRRNAATNASCGTSTRPICFIFFLPSFWRSSSLRLRGDVAAVALREHVLALGLDRLPGDDAPADRSLDRHVEQLARDQLAQLRRHLAAVLVRLVAVHDRGERVDRSGVEQHVDLREVRNGDNRPVRSRGSRSPSCATSSGRRSRGRSPRAAARRRARRDPRRGTPSSPSRPAGSARAPSTCRRTRSGSGSWCGRRAPRSPRSPAATASPTGCRRPRCVRRSVGAGTRRSASSRRARGCIHVRAVRARSPCAGGRGSRSGTRSRAHPTSRARR